MELPLSELVIEDFTRSWTHFKFIATAKKWNAEKQLTVIPTLLRDKLIDYHGELDDATKGDIKLLKVAVMTTAVLLQRFLTRNKLSTSVAQEFAEALEAAVEIEYAFKFSGENNTVQAVAQPRMKPQLPDAAAF